MTEIEQAKHDHRVQTLVDQLVLTIALPVYPSSLEIHFSPDGKVQKVEAHSVPYRRPGKA